MEEWIGLCWHRLVTRWAAPQPTGTPVRLEDVRPSVLALLHAGGATQRLAQAAPMRVGGHRDLWQRLAGSGRRQPLPQLDPEVLALPEQVALFDAPDLNRGLYLWWAALAGSIDRSLPWVAANLQAQAQALQRFPGLADLAQRLTREVLALRPGTDEDPAERQVRQALQLHALNAEGRGPEARDVAPVWTWLVLVPPSAPDLATAGGDDLPARRGGEMQDLGQRRRTRTAPRHPGRAPLLLAPKGESLKTFADPMAMDRAEDDGADDDLDVAAQELEALTLQRRQGSLSSRIRFDLDLPSAAADDLPVGPGVPLPEWDPRSASLRPDRVMAQSHLPRDPTPWQPHPALRAAAAQVRRRMDRQRAAMRWRTHRDDGEEVDLDAWVQQQALARDGREVPAVYRRRAPMQRELATLALADLSLSTDAHANDEQRIIDVVRDALYVLGEAMAGHGDAFAMLGFSSLRRSLRLHELKDFDEPWATRTLARLGAIKPGYYTRMGAALRAGTRRLAGRPERQRLLLLLTDGKPHDLDGYDGRWGVEDTRQAVLEARRAGVLPFALSIDAQAGDAMPTLFGHQGWAWVQRPAELPMRLASLYAQLSR